MGIENIYGVSLVVMQKERNEIEDESRITFLHDNTIMT